MLGSCSARLQKITKDNDLSGIMIKKVCSLMLLMYLLQFGEQLLVFLNKVFFYKKFKKMFNWKI